MPDRRSTGRPPLQRGERSVSVCVKLPTSHYDAVYQRASRERLSVPELIRRAAGAAFRPAGGDDDDDDDED